MTRTRNRSRRTGTRAAGAALGLAALITACASAPTSSPSADTAPGTTPRGSDVATGASAPVLFSPEGNNLWAYDTTPPFRSQKVNAANHTFDGSPGSETGWDINGQVCSFDRDGITYLVTGEDTHQPEPPAGWGVFALTGSRVGEFALQRVARLVPTYQPTEDGPDTYGCGVLSDGRIVTTDIGNTALGDANGQLTIWFPPFSGDRVASCKLDLHVATGQGVYVDRGAGADGSDVLYLNSPRPSDDPEATSAGVFRYTGPFPTSADAAGGCGRTDNLGSPLTDTLHKERVLSAGEHGLVSPSGITRGPNGHFFVSSVITGVIDEYDATWQFVQTVLQPPAGEQLGDAPFSTGTPLGITVGPDGTLYDADIGIVKGGSAGFGPGKQTGSVRRITFTNGRPNPPETMASTLQFPDGLGLVTPQG